MKRLAAAFLLAAVAALARGQEPTGYVRQKSDDVVLKSGGTPTPIGITFKVAGTAAATEAALNFILGPNMTISCVDNTGAGQADCTFTAAGGGSTTFDAIGSGTNTTAAMVVGTGGSLAASGTGTIAATSTPFSGVSTSTNTTATMTCGTGCSITTSGSGSNTASAVAAGAVGTSGLANNAATNAKQGQMAAYTWKGNNTNATANAADLTQAQFGVAAMNRSASSRNVYDEFDECDKGYVNNSTAPGCTTLQAFESGTGANVFESNGQNTNTHTWIDVNHPGVVEAISGTTATPNYAYLAGTNAVANVTHIFGPGLAIELLIHDDTASDGTNTYTTYTGWTGSVTNATAPASGVFASYTHGTNSGNFVLNVCKASTCTTGNSATAGAAAGWRHVLIWEDAAGSNVHFAFDCTTPENPGLCSEATGSPLVTTNIPTVAVTPFMGIVKSAGTTSRSIALDYYHAFMIGGLTR